MYDFTQCGSCERRQKHIQTFMNNNESTVIHVFPDIRVHTLLLQSFYIAVHSSCFLFRSGHVLEEVSVLAVMDFLSPFAFSH